jgi:uncharacterized SAM-binding protein YcdF (DUF218 family)
MIIFKTQLKPDMSMFFMLSKILLFLISPFIWAFILLFFALFTKKPSRKRNYLIISSLILLLFSNQFLFNEVEKKWETPAVKIENVDKYDYAILLGGFSSYDTATSKVNFTEAADRFCQTLQLYQQKKIKKIFISGGSGQLLHQDLTEADKIKTFLISLNVPESDILIEATSRNTHENATNTAKYLKKHDPAARCLLVTSAMHMPRALGCFKKAGLNVTAYPTNFLAESRKFDFDILVFPKPYILSRWDSLIKEWVGYFTYKILGYL